MGVLLRGAVVAAGAVAMLAGAVSGLAGASAAPALGRSRTLAAVTSHNVDAVGRGHGVSPLSPGRYSGSPAVLAAGASGAGSVTTYTGTGISGPDGITDVPDGALWFTNSGNNSIGRISTTGIVTNYTGTGISTPTGIAVGPDGALWFTNSGNNSIGRISTTGIVTNYTGMGISVPEGITAGPNGALWFTNSGNNSIGQITTTGTVTNYTGIGISRPLGITAGPDGAPWFTNSGNNSIGRISNTGQVTNYTGVGIRGPVGIATGRDGSLWFTNSGNNSIGRFRPLGGEIHNYTGTGVSDPQGISAGPDGALWFTNSGNNSIGRISSSTGKIINYSGTGISGPDGITAARDGAMWFTDMTGSSIGRITTKIISTIDTAGYIASVTAGSPTASAATFTVPELSCTTASRAITPSTGVGVNNHATSSFAYMFIGCVSGKAVYYPGLIINGTEHDFTATRFAAGDVVSLFTAVTTSGTTVQVTDVTTGVNKKLTGAGASADAAYIIDAGWATNAGTLLGVPVFATLTFTSCLVDGIALDQWHPAEYLRATKAGIVQIAPGALSPGASTAFTTYYNHM